MLLVIRLICCAMRIPPCLCLLLHLWGWDIGHWRIYSEYHAVGKNIGAVTYDFLDKGDREGVDLVTIPGNYTFDIKRLHEFKLDSLNLPQGAVLVNKTPSFYEQYKYWVIGVVSAFMFLIACFLIAIYYIIRINT